MSAVGESSPDEDPGVMANDKVVAVNCSKEMSEAENEPAMLDEEEMPSYVSLASLQIPDDSKVDSSVVEPAATLERPPERAQSPCASEHGAESVCVLSSGEESDRRPFEGMEDYDSEGTTEMEEEEDEESCMNEEEDEEDEEEDSDGDIEPEQFERSSDDFVLRYDSGLEKHHRERSRSLQDLTNSSRGNLSRFVGKRRSIDHMGGPFEPEFTRELHPLDDPLDVRKRSNRAPKYGHVTSKVKQYIQDMKEQRRRSAEHASRALPLQQIDSSDVNSRDPEITNVPENLKRIKSYVRNAINEMKSSVEDDENCADTRATEEAVEPEAITENVSPSNETSPENLAKRPRISLKTNGLADHVAKDEESLRHLEVNGPQENPGIFDLRSLTYEEYTNGDEKVEKVEKVDRTEAVQPKPEARKVTAEVDRVARVSRAARNTGNVREATPDEASRRKVIMVDSELYQKMLEENAAMKRELEETRKNLERSRAEIRELEEAKKNYERQMARNVPPETSVASVQTERDASEEKTSEATTCAEEASSKLLSSTVTSALSSIEQWSDSNCSPAISIDPPNIEAALNVDDSIAFAERTAKKSSSSFVAGSRILQTLDSITRGRAKTGPRQWIAADDATTRNDEPPGEQGQSKRQTLEASNPGNANTPRARKRCAADMLGLSNHSESFKIPHTPGAGGDTRRKMSSGSAADAALKIINEAKQARANAEKKINETVEPHLGGDTDNTESQNNVRFIVYQEEPDCKQRSFLIQAEEPAANEDTGEKGGKVRECGPFLLGNVEIRMTEVNGTLNIWGKEIGETSQDQEVAMETEDSGSHDRSSFMPRSPFVCQSTPHPKCPHANEPASVACSRVATADETPKPRISPRFGRSGIGKYLRAAASNLSRNNSAAETSNNGLCANSPRPDNERTNDCCEHCETHRQKRIKWPSCEHQQARLNQHSCCLHNAKREFDCPLDNDVFDDSTIYETMSNILANHEKCNALNVTPKQTCTNADKEEICGIRTSCRHMSLGREENSRQTKKRCSSCNVADPCARVRLTPGSCRSQNIVFSEDEAHPLLSSNTPCETPETKRRRLSGKKVRGILTDLLRGCSGCREPNSTSSLPRANRQTVIPKVHLSPCSSSEASCSKQTQSCPSHLNHSSNEVTNERCCNSCTRRAEMRAEIENQLEVFRVTMEQLRSRSDTVLEMLHLLKAETD